MSAISLTSPVGFFPLRLVAYDPTGLHFPWGEGEAEAETMDGEGRKFHLRQRHQWWRHWEAGWRQVVVGGPC